jgi:hypothetical protein
MMPDWYNRYENSWEDFWGRRGAKSRYWREFQLFDRAVRLHSNEEQVITAVDHSLPLYSQLPSTSHTPFDIQIVVRASRSSPGLAPDDLMQHITYTGDGSWLMWHLAGWGQVYVDLAKGTAVATITPELAQRPDLISQCLLNTIFLNFFIANGYGMLHASGLVKDGRLLLLMAPHNTGKSTTALHLLLAGCQLVSDSMIFVTPDEGYIAGFPIGKIKLRKDMLPQFPQLHSFLAAEAVRDETKYSLDLRRFDKKLVVETAVSPQKTILCLLTRHDALHTVTNPATLAAVQDAVLLNSLFYDTPAIWQRHLRQIETVLQQAAPFHLTIGTDAQGIVTAVNQLITK